MMDVSKECSEANADKQLPELNQALLNWNTVEDLFDDLNSCARITDVQAKRMAGSFCDQQALSLEEAMDLLKSGHARAIQIRYDYQNQSWCDTLIRRGEKFHLTRIT